MGMQNPAVNEPIDKLSEEIPEGQPFYLIGIRTVKATSADFGEGEMVIVRVRDHTRELGVWGSYLLAQAKSIDDSDLNKWWKIERGVVPGFGKGRPVKQFVPADAPAGAQVSADELGTIPPNTGNVQQTAADTTPAE